MAKIRFSNGQVVNFEGNPTQADVEEVAVKLGLQKAPAPAAQPKSFLQKAGDVMTGVAGFTGGKKIAQGLGQGIANAMGTQSDLAKTYDQSSDIQGQLLKTIKTNKAAGKDTSRLEKALKEITAHLGQAGQDVSQIGNQEGITGKQIAGDALQLGTTILGAGSYSKAGLLPNGKFLSSGLQGAKTVLPSAIGGVTKNVGTGVLQGALQGAKSGAITGGIYGASSGVSNALLQDKTLGEAAVGGLKGALGGAISGGIIGGAIGGVSGGIKQYQENKAKQDWIDKLVTPPTDKGKTALQAIKTGKVKEGVGLGGKRDFSKAITGMNDIKQEVAKVPGIAEGNSKLQNLNAIHDHIGVIAEDLKGKLESSKVSFTPKEFNKFMTTAKSGLEDNITLVGDQQKIANKILDKFNVLVKQNGYTPSGLLEARKQLDSWVLSQKGAKVFDPALENAFSSALSAVRQGGNDFIARLVPDAGVKEALRSQSNLYRAIDTLAPQALKEGGTKLQRLLAAMHKHPVASFMVGTVASGPIMSALTGAARD